MELIQKLGYFKGKLVAGILANLESRSPGCKTPIMNSAFECNSIPLHWQLSSQLDVIEIQSIVNLFLPSALPRHGSILYFIFKVSNKNVLFFLYAR